MDLTAAIALVVADTRAEDPDRTHGMTDDEVLVEVRSELDLHDIDLIKTDLSPDLAAAYRAVLSTDEGATAWTR